MQKTFLAAGSVVMLVSISCIAVAVYGLLTTKMGLLAPMFWSLVACHALSGVAAMHLLERARSGSKGGAQ